MPSKWRGNTIHSYFVLLLISFRVEWTYGLVYWKVRAQVLDLCWNLAVVLHKATYMSGVLALYCNKSKKPNQELLQGVIMETAKISSN